LGNTTRPNAHGSDRTEAMLGSGAEIFDIRGTRLIGQVGEI
jgi:hypothetical protein